MKKFLIIACISAACSSFLLSGCSSEEPKEQPKKESASQAIQAAADKAKEAIDKTAASSKNLAEKAEEIKDTARKAAADMSATVLKSNPQAIDNATVPKEAPTPAEGHK
jgi:seryl-tRNA synthetase